MEVLNQVREETDCTNDLMNIWAECRALRTHFSRASCEAQE